MDDVLAEVRLPPQTALEKDACYNTFAFKFDDMTSEAEAIVYAAYLQQFYDNNYGLGSISNFIDSFIVRGSPNPWQVKFYDAHAGPPNPPLWTKTFVVTRGSTELDGLPAEVACCASFHADLTGVPEGLGTSERQRQRRRGRVFIGPLIANGASMRESPTGIIRPNVPLMTTLNSAVEGLNGSGNGLYVFSRVDDTFYRVVGGHVDNRFDTIRGRGQKRTGRLEWP